jgi:diguanylate cyclase
MVEANTNLQERLAVAEQQIEAQAAEIQSHESEARTDSLTGLANRRAFDDELSRRVAEWQRKKTPVTLAILDIDFFKKFNDEHGHLAGDEVLRHFGGKLIEATRDMDIPCRYGGEEFSVIMPATTAEDGTIVAERIRTAIECTEFNFEGKVLKVTASVGLAEISGKEDAKLLLKRSDDALYRSKAAGRNCGHLHLGNEIVPITPGIESVCDSQKNLEKISYPPTELLDHMPTHGVFNDELRRRVSESHRFGVPLSVMRLEVEDFESISQKYGREAAHKTLDVVAQFISTSLREMDLLARFGDGQFAMMLPGSTLVEAAQIGQRIQAALIGSVLPIGDTQLQLRVNLGVAESDRGDTVETLMRRAEDFAQLDSTPKLVTVGG